MTHLTAFKELLGLVKIALPLAVDKMIDRSNLKTKTLGFNAEIGSKSSCRSISSCKIRSFSYRMISPLISITIYRIQSRKI